MTTKKTAVKTKDVANLAERIGDLPSLKSGIKKHSCWEMAEDVIPHARRVLLYGPPATGKTHAGVYQTPNEEVEIVALTLTEETPDSELRGHWVPQGSGLFKWLDGPVLDAWRHGKRLVLNEINNCSPEAETLLYVILDDHKTAKITLPNGETVSPHPDFTCVATMNGKPEDLPEALRSRMPVTIQIDKTNPSALNNLPPELRPLAKGTIDQTGKDRIDIRSWCAFVEVLEAGTQIDICGLSIFGLKWPNLREAVLLALQTIPSKRALPIEKEAANG
jgi:MoxR-like ATPase